MNNQNNEYSNIEKDMTNYLDIFLDRLSFVLVTISTVGYGDISPITNLGQFIAAAIMIMGYVIIAVPTGIVATEMRFSNRRKKATCIVCGDKDQRLRAKFCDECGAKISIEKSQ